MPAKSGARRGEILRHRAVGSVDVEPERFAPAEFGQLVEGIDRARVDRAGVADDDRGREPRGPILGDRARERVHANAEPVVGRDLAQVARAHAEQIDRLVDAGVHLIGGVNGERRGAREAIGADVSGASSPCRAVASAVKLAMDPPETRIPSASDGRPMISASHRTTRSSTWIAAWSPPQQLGFIAAARKSAAMPIGSAVALMKP